MSEENEQKDSDQREFDQAVSRIEAERDRVDSFMVHVKWIVTVVNSLVLVVVGFVAFLGISNINDIGDQMKENATNLVRQAIENDEETINEITDLNKLLNVAQQEYSANKEAIDALSILAELSGVERSDPAFAYERLEKFENEESTAENRGVAFKLLRNIIDAGINGEAEPNILFNASVVASRLNFEIEASKLAALAVHWRPSRSHKALEAENADKFGVAFEIADDSLNQRQGTPTEVRASAWGDLLTMIRSAPRVEGEQVYSRASNVAVRNRSAGYYQELADAIVQSENSQPDSLTSYAYITLAEMYAFEGAKGWEPLFWGAIRKSLELLQEESMVCSWYEHTVRETLRSVTRLKEVEKFMELSAELNISEDFWIMQVQ